MGDTAGAVEDCKKAMELLNPDSAEASMDQGLLDFISGDYKKAVGDWEMTVQRGACSSDYLQSWIEKAKSKLNK